MVDYATLKKWVPNYANVQSIGINKPAPSDGFIFTYYSAYANTGGCQITIRVNNRDVAFDYTEAPADSGARIASTSAFVPVSAGDIVTINGSAGHIDRIAEVIFFPGKWV